MERCLECEIKTTKYKQISLDINMTLCDLTVILQVVYSNNTIVRSKL